MTSVALYASLLIGTGSLAWGYYDGGYRHVAFGLLGFGLLWALAQWRRWTWSASLGLLAVTAAAAAGLWLELAAGWMVVGALGGLLAWDLSDFARRLRCAPPRRDMQTLEKVHLARLAILFVFGLLLATGAMLLQLRFTFEWALLLALVAALGITRLVAWLRRGGE